MSPPTLPKPGTRDRRVYEAVPLDDWIGAGEIGAVFHWSSEYASQILLRLTRRGLLEKRVVATGRPGIHHRYRRLDIETEMSVAEKVMVHLRQHGPCTARQLMDATGCEPHHPKNMTRYGHIKAVERGLYAAVEVDEDSIEEDEEAEYWRRAAEGCERLRQRLIEVEELTA